MAPPPPPPLSDLKPADKANPELILSCRLQEASTVDDVRTIVAELDINLDERPALSQMVFNHVLNTCHHATDIHAFLSDRSLNTPEAWNFATLMGYLVEHGAQMDDVEAHIELLRRILASISCDELATVVRLIPDIKVDGDNTLEKENPERLGSFLATLWKRTARCRKLRAKYRGNMDFFNAWLDTILTRRPTVSSLSVAKNIISTQQKNSPLRYFTLYILQQLKLARDNSHVPMWSSGSKAYASPDVPVLRYLRKVDSVGKLLSRESFAMCLTDVTEALLVAPGRLSEVTQNHESYLIWAFILQRIKCAPELLSMTEIHTDFKRQRMVDNCAPSRSMEQRCVLRLWLVTNLGRCTVLSKKWRDQRRSTFAALFDYLESSSLQDGDALTHSVHLLQELKSEGLANTRDVTTAAAKLEFRRTVDDKTGSLSSRIDRLHRLIEDGYLTSMKLLTRGYSKDVNYGPNMWFYELAQSVDITAREFLDEIMQYMDEQAPRRAILRGMLSYHLGAKIALSLAHNVPGGSSSSIEEGSDDMPPTQAFRKSNDSPTGSWSADGRFTPDPAACLQTFHTLALIYAFSSNLHTEGAWRRSYWCYKFLKQHRAPICPLVVRSLYYAGIVRYRKEGKKVPPEKFQFILRLAERVEGPAAADQIRWRERNA